MSHRTSPSQLFASALSLALLAAYTCSVNAAEPPKRKAGLWEIRTQMEGMPMTSSMQMCIDKNTDDLLKQERHEKKPECSTMDFKSSGNRISLHAVCKIDKSTVTMDGTYTGSFDSSYKSSMTMKYNPPIEGMSTMKMNQEAKWLGACKPGQKPGDVIVQPMAGMGGAGSVNINEMMNNPQIQEMMKRHK